MDLSYTEQLSKDVNEEYKDHFKSRERMIDPSETPKLETLDIEKFIPKDVVDVIAWKSRMLDTIFPIDVRVKNNLHTLEEALIFDKSQAESETVWNAGMKAILEGKVNWDLERQIKKENIIRDRRENFIGGILKKLKEMLVRIFEETFGSNKHFVALIGRFNRVKKQAKAVGDAASDNIKIRPNDIGKSIKNIGENFSTMYNTIKRFMTGDLSTMIKTIVSIIVGAVNLFINFFKNLISKIGAGFKGPWFDWSKVTFTVNGLDSIDRFNIIGIIDNNMAVQLSIGATIFVFLITVLLFFY